ncbi:MAG: hypothetical protein ACXADY_07405 [Candidatus Hodarchaeales archaeon]|jgi:hypothetical protein
MEPYIVCKDCGEKTSTNFRYCGKCGAEIPKVKKTPQSVQVPSTQEKTNFNSVEEEDFSSSASSDYKELKSTFTTGKPITTYLYSYGKPNLTFTSEEPITKVEIERKARRTVNVLDVMLIIPLIIKIRKGKRVSYEINEREFMNVTGGWRVLSKFLICFLIVVIFWGDLTIFWGSLTSDWFWQSLRTGPFIPFIITGLLMIIWGVGITIPFVIIGQLFDVSIFKVKNPDGSPMGKIKRNLTGTTWKILGSSNETLALIKLPLTGINFLKPRQMRTGEIKTPLGSFKAEAQVSSVSTSQYKGYYIATNCNVTDSNDNHCFSVTLIDYRSNPKYGWEYIIDSQGIMTPFLTFTISVCLIDKFMSKIKSYDHTPDSGCGCD